MDSGIERLFPPVVDRVPVGEHGSARVSHINGCAVLVIDDVGYMNDFEQQQRDRIEVIELARGSVLLGGLGLGMQLLPLESKPAVESITVIERNRDVIELIGPRYSDLTKLQIVEADCWSWEPQSGQRFDCVYLDIWPIKTPLQARVLVSRYSQWLTPDGWIGAWGL